MIKEQQTVEIKAGVTLVRQQEPLVNEDGDVVYEGDAPQTVWVPRLQLPGGLKRQIFDSTLDEIEEAVFGWYDCDDPDVLWEQVMDRIGNIENGAHLGTVTVTEDDVEFSGKRHLR